MWLLWRDIVLIEFSTTKMQMQTQPKTSNKILNANMVPHLSEYQIKKGNKSETRYKVSLVLEDSEIPAYFTLPAMLTQFTEFSENGDAEKFSKNPDDGKMSASLKLGVPDVVARQMPTLEEDQKSAVTMLKGYHEALVLHAFNNLPEKGSGSCSFAAKARIQAKKENPEDWQARAAEIYLEKSHRGGIVEKDIDGTPTEMVVMKRKVTSYENGEKGRYPPVFHKIDFEGKYHELEVGDYLQRGTLVQCRARPQFFSAPSMYGTTLTLDKDIIVVWRPKSRKRSNQSEVVPAFVDGDDESELESEPVKKRAKNE
tara:strand:+ start:687 stop:1625 length:939 start_codon:yes stop_codon:yes gene_type:complete